ncbi:MAG TPA: glycosyltransferase family 4 protein [Pyrinomonadaceae bacterium]
MKVVVLSLVGSSVTALDALAERYPTAEVHKLTRQQLESAGSIVERLKMIRSLRPDVFVVLTQQLGWQRAKNAFMIFGAMAGARECCILDVEGNLLQSSSGKALLTGPLWLGGELASSASSYVRTLIQLRSLENSVARGIQFRPQTSDRDAPTIAYIRATPGPGTQAGGAASHMKGVITALTQLDAKVNVITNDVIAGFDNDVATTVVTPNAAGLTRAAFDLHLNLSFTEVAVPLVQQIDPDFIYQRYARFNWTGAVAARATKRPLFMEYNGSEVWVARHWDKVGNLNLLARFEDLNLRAASRIFVVSEVEARNLKERDVSPDKLIVNPNGVETEMFRPGVGGDTIRHELGLAGEDVVVGFVGTFGPWHGVLTFAEAIKTLAETNVRFLLVGTGSLQMEMERMLASEIESRRVIFTGAVAHERVPVYLDACDILVAPHVPLSDGSDFFGSPTKLFEYMAMGKGIVASRLGQIGDVLQHEETALLVTPGDVAELSVGIMRLANSPEMRAALGTKARKEAVDKYTWQHNAQRVLNAYRGLVGE